MRAYGQKKQVGAGIRSHNKCSCEICGSPAPFKGKARGELKKETRLLIKEAQEKR